MITDWVLKATIVLILFKPITSFANDIYINQVGDDLTMAVTQDGQDNTIRSQSTTSGDAQIVGNTKTFTVTQQGDNNRSGFWTNGNTQVMTLTQEGNSNVSRMDNHGNNNDMSVAIDGNSNSTHTEIGNGGDINNQISVTIDNGDSNAVYTEVQNGSTNSIDIQLHEQSNNINRVTVNGSNNNVKAWQGKHEDGSVDTDETGDNDVYWVVSGSNNNLASYQTDDNNNGGQHIANYVSGSGNDVKHTQRGAGDHRGFVEITGDNNDVEVLQRGNTDTQFADIVLDDGHTVDVYQRYGSHTANIDLTNAGGGYTLDLDQTANTNQTYNLTGTCATVSGCGLTITQN
jgi:hypothetical protein